MAALVLGAAGNATGGSIGGFIGSTIGSVVDSWIISSLAPTQRIEGARLDTLRITSATEGAANTPAYRWTAYVVYEELANAGAVAASACV